MKKKPTLSIITICYNIKDEIERTCENIISQTWQDFEWIVVDGGSTDGTVDVLKKYQDRINILISEKDSGVYNAMNKGIRRATGEWLNFMNGGDCFAANDVLEKVFKDKIYDADVLYGWQYFAKSKTWRKYTTNPTLEWMCSNALGHQAMFIKKNCFDKYGLYDESFKILADFEHNVCFKKNGCSFEYLPFEVAWFAEDGISSDSSKRNIWIEELCRIYNKYYTLDEILLYGREFCKPFFLHPIISLTSYPARIGTVHKTIETLLNQSIKAEKIVLYLGADKFPNREKDIPVSLKSLISSKFEIRWIEKDLRSFSKLIPALNDFSNEIIITADDDILYPENWLELLLEGYLKYPNMISCHRAHRVGFDKHKRLLPYLKWMGKNATNTQSFLNFLTGVGGVLYPPGALYKDVFEIEKFQKLCPQADDIWFWAMAVLNNTKINVVKNNITALKYVPGTQEAETCLWKTNNGPENLNDTQLKNVLNEYPEIMEKILSDPAIKMNKLLYSRGVETSYKLFSFIPLLSIEEK